MGVEQSLEGVMQSNCRIVIIAPRNGEDCLSVLGTLPSSARILAIGNNLEELQAGEGFFSEVRY